MPSTPLAQHEISLPPDRNSAKPDAALPTVLLACPLGELGGAEQVTLATARLLPEFGMRPVFVTMRPGPLADIAREAGIEAHAFPVQHRVRQLAKVVQAINWLTNIGRQTHASLLHATHSAHLYTSISAHRLGVPEVWHQFDTRSKFNATESIIRRLPTSHVIFMTRTVRDSYPRLARKPNTIIPPLCVEPAAITAQPDAADVPERLNIPAGPMLLTVARLQEHKGHPYLLEAAQRVLEKRPDAVFVVAGKAAGVEQEQYLSGLHAQAKELRIEPRVVFTGFITDADLASLYRRATALVHPAWSENYGLVLLEAMAMGLPVIAAAAAGPSEIIQSNENGLLVPTKDVPGLATAILKLLEDESLRRSLAAAGAVTAASLTPRSMVQQMAAVFAGQIASSHVPVS